jgi:hypothetical protein
VLPVNVSQWQLENFVEIKRLLEKRQQAFEQIYRERGRICYRRSWRSFDLPWNCGIWSDLTTGAGWCLNFSRSRRRARRRFDYPRERGNAERKCQSDSSTESF